MYIYVHIYEYIFIYVNMYVSEYIYFNQKNLQTPRPLQVFYSYKSVCVRPRMHTNICTTHPPICGVNSVCML